jgi:transposase InsO family protein
MQIAGKLDMPASTVYAVLVRCRVDRRYERGTPGSLVHVDVKKLGNIPDGGGWRYVGKSQGYRNRAAPTSRPRRAKYYTKKGTEFVHGVLDNHSRVVYSEVHDDELKETAIAVLRRAVFWFAARGGAWREACRDLDIKHRRTRPYRPQTDGKIERFHRTLANGWAYARHYGSESARRNALQGWIHHYNHHRAHTATGKSPPIKPLTNFSGQYS